MQTWCGLWWHDIHIDFYDNPSIGWKWLRETGSLIHTGTWWCPELVSFLSNTGFGVRKWPALDATTSPVTLLVYYLPHSLDNVCRDSYTGFGLEDRNSLPNRGNRSCFFVTTPRNSLGPVQPPNQYVRWGSFLIGWSKSGVYYWS